MSIVLLDARSESVTISWPGTKMAKCYILEYRLEDERQWERLSDKLKQTYVRKKNLDPTQAYFFRVAPVFGDGPGLWITHDQGFFPLTYEEEEYAMNPPYVEKVENECLVISWDEHEDGDYYELQMRENLGGAEWFTVADGVEYTEVKKRRLRSPNGYMFRVRPLNEEFDEAFSPPSDAVVAVPPRKPRNRPRPPVRRDREEEEEPEDFSMPAPWVKNAGPQALLVRWAHVNGARGYELQMRENNKRGEWATIAESLTGTEVKKKNLTSRDGYQFRVRPLGVRASGFSVPSYGAIASQAPVRGGRR